MCKVMLHSMAALPVRVNLSSNLDIQDAGIHTAVWSRLRYTGICSRPSCKNQFLASAAVGSLCGKVLEVL